MFMRHILRVIGIVLAAAIVLGNSQCQQNSSSADPGTGAGTGAGSGTGTGTGTGTDTGSGPTFATTLQVEDANSNPTSEFSAGQLVDFAVSVDNVNNTPLIVLVHSCMPPAGVAVVNTDTSQVVYYGSQPAGPICEWVSLGGVPQSIAPGATQTYMLAWVQLNSTGEVAVPPGHYEAIGLFPCLYPPPANGPSGNYDVNDCGSIGSLPSLSALAPDMFHSAPVAFTIE